MDLTRTAYGTWSGGRYMHFGETLDEKRYLESIRVAYESGIRTFVTAEVYGQTKADQALGEALADYPRDSYCLVGMLGHDFDKGVRNGSAGYPRFTDSTLRNPAEYEGFLRGVCERSLESCRTDHFDLVMLHNPDEAGYTQEAVWQAMGALKTSGLTEQLGIAPGPANGFTLDIVKSFELFGDLMDWAMIILNPLEPWPGQYILPAAEKYGVKILTRVVDYGGIFHDDLKPGHELGAGDHRAYRPEGWIEAGNERMERMRPIAEKYGLSMLHFASIWNLSQPMVRSVVPTIIQEAGADARPIEDKIRDFSGLPDVTLTPEEVEAVREIGDNTGCMMLKGASKRHERSERPDEWPMRDDLLELAGRYSLGQEW